MFNSKPISTMKKFIIFGAAVGMLAALASCNKQETVSSPAAQQLKGKAELTVTVRGNVSGSKATVADTENEAKINGLQVFVFNEDALDMYGVDNTGADHLTIAVTKGSRSVYALVNAPDLSAVAYKSELLASVSKLTDNADAGNSFVMIGDKDVVIADATPVSINVKRIAARIKLDKLTRNFTNSQLAGLAADQFKIVRYYVTESAGDINYGLTSSYAPTIWHSSSLNDPKAIESSRNLLCHSIGLASLAEDSSYETAHSFYVYPNPAADATVAEPAPANPTRLVVELEIKGQKYAYPIPMPVIESNKSYEIRNLVITRLGNTTNGDDILDEGEDVPIEILDVQFEVVVLDWDLELLGENGVVTI